MCSKFFLLSDWSLFVTAHRCRLCLPVAVEQEAGWAPGSVRTPWRREWSSSFSVVSSWRSYCTEWPVPVFRTIKYCNKSCRELWKVFMSVSFVPVLLRRANFFSTSITMWTRNLGYHPELVDFDIFCVTHFHSPSPDMLFVVYVQKRFQASPRCWDLRSSRMLRIVD